MFVTTICTDLVDKDSNRNMQIHYALIFISYIELGNLLKNVVNLMNQEFAASSYPCVCACYMLLNIMQIF